MPNTKYTLTLHVGIDKYAFYTLNDNTSFFKCAINDVHYMLYPTVSENRGLLFYIIRY